MYIYIFGVCFSGLLFSLLKNINSFYLFLIDKSKKHKKEMKDNGEVDLTESAILDGFDDNHVIDILSIVIALLSWIGLIFIAKFVIQWLINMRK